MRHVNLKNEVAKMSTGLIITFIGFVVAEVCIVIYICILHSKDAKRYEAQIKNLEKKVARRDKEIDLQKFVIDTQSAMISKLRG